MEFEHPWIHDQIYRRYLEDRLAKAERAAQLRELASDGRDTGMIRTAVGTTMVRVGSWIGGAPVRAYAESAGAGRLVADC